MAFWIGLSEIRIYFTSHGYNMEAAILTLLEHLGSKTILISEFV